MSLVVLTARMEECPRCTNGWLNRPVELDVESTENPSAVGSAAQDMRVTGILDHKISRDEQKFLVQWDSMEEPAWVDAVNLRCHALLEGYFRRIGTQDLSRYERAFRRAMIVD